ncbi:MAG: methylated-DNA--[protein]-cysteine S-methyltransferase [Acidimicrobiales bacterium]|nr:methylated-DNA--[protein]-cysteine S-methyltransferase [Acidimicrobiales bacterium]
MSTITTTVYRTIDSPIGPLTIAGHDGVVTHLRMVDQAHPPSDQVDWVRAPDDEFADVVDQLDRYFRGDLTDFDVPLEMNGTEFQETVWRALREIPYGETWSYGELARHIGKPGASRAVGLANGRNPISIIVPCHRVIGADGSMTGYGGGLERKVHLLEHERSRETPQLPL